MHFLRNRLPHWHSLLPMLMIAATVVLFTQCNSSSANQTEGEAQSMMAYSAYVSARTTGSISAKSNIQVRLSQPLEDSTLIGTTTDLNIFSFSPSVKGTTSIEDAYTLTFTPTSPLPSDQSYSVKVALDELLKIEGDPDDFEFSIRTIQQNFAVSIKGAEMYDDQNLTRQKVLGTLSTADYMEPSLAENLVTAVYKGSSYEISWEHSPNGRDHNFSIENITRTETEGTLEVQYDGNPADIDISGTHEVIITPLGDFSLTGAEVVNGNEQHIIARFSEPIMTNQNLNGLISIPGGGNLKFVVDGNTIKVYPAVAQNGIKTLTVSPGIKNINGFATKRTFDWSLTFRQVDPDIRLVNSGTILPNAGKLTFPFEAVNLHSVEVKIIRIFEDNITQFLQKNDLAGNQEIQRVGRPIFHKDVPLNQTEGNLSEWQRYSLDLAELIQAEPGAIYRVELSFRKSQSAYACPGTESADGLVANTDTWDEGGPEVENSYWDGAENYYNYQPYDYQDRDDPCTESYYTYRRLYSKKQQNIFASNVGLIAKQGAEGDLWVFANSILSTDPLPGVEITAYNFQQQPIATGTTDGSGIAQLPVDGSPFLVVAKNGDQSGYLRVNSQSSLSMSNFDVSGQHVQKGLKGMIYGERGVWRPGDTLFMTFILEDQLKRLPENHPVIFELVNPFDQVVDRQVRTAGLNGFYRFTSKTASDAPTGNWISRVRVGGATFIKSLPLETIKPNRLKIQLDFGTETLSADDATYKGDLKVTWLHGAKAGGLRARFDVTLTQSNTSFPKYSDYTFDDPTKRFESEEREIFDGYLNEDGETTIAGAFNPEPKAPGKLMAFFRGQVFEEGGDFSIDQFSIPYYPFESFVGIKTPKGDAARGMLLTDEKHTVDLRSVTPKGEPSPNRTLDLKVYKLNWRWWWDQSANNAANYLSGRGLSPVANGTTTTNARGEGSWEFEIEYPDWGRYVVVAKDRASGHQTGKVVYVDWPGWAGRGQRDNPGGESALAFGTDKATYTLGEEVQLSIPSSGQGRALVSLETGSDVLQTFWVNTEKGETKFEFTTTADMAPNVYVHVTLLQPHNHPDNDLPIRLYGVTPIKVEDPNTLLHPEIAMTEEIRPESQVTIEVSEADGKAMTYTVAMVDEGLLDLTRFPTPNPWNTFYAREALGVRSWDLYEDVIGAYGGDLERILAIGGDGFGEENAPQSEANRFKPVVRYFGPFELDKGRSNEHTFQMPPYIGSVKTMIIAGQDGAYGSADQVTPVRKPLMALATLPRVLGPGEQVKLPVNIFTLSDDLKDVSITIETNELLTIEGSATKQLRFEEAGDQIATFDLTAVEGLGVARVKVMARSGQEEASYDIELQVRNPNPYVTDVDSELLEAGKSWSTSVNPIGMVGTNTATLEVSRIPPIDLGRRLKYLLQYPHGCIEQTTSSVFPQVYLNKVQELTPKLEERIEQNIKAGIARIRTFQTSRGGFSYWPGESESSPWGSNYAGHFLLEVKAQGYNVPDNLLRKWRRYQREEARNWQKQPSYHRSDLIQAYRLYTLALAGHPEMGAMNKLRSTTDLSESARWRLAAAYAAAGKVEVAKEIINGQGLTVSSYTEMGGSYGSNVRDEAMILETLVLMNEQGKSAEVLQNIAGYLSDQRRWMSTQTTAYCLLSIGKLSADLGASNSLEFKYAIYGSSPANASTELPLVQIDIPMEGRTSPGKVTITNSNQGVLYARLITQGQPLRSQEVASEENLSITVRYKDMDLNPISIDNLEQGQEFMAEVEVYNPGTKGTLEEVALTQVFPSGWEIINTRLNGGTNAYEASVPDYQDIRDDRVYTYFDLRRGKRKTFRVLLNATYEGRYYLPSVKCEAMYDNTVQARTKGQEVVVRKP